MIKIIIAYVSFSYKILILVVFKYLFYMIVVCKYCREWV